MRNVLKSGWIKPAFDSFADRDGPNDIGVAVAATGGTLTVTGLQTVIGSRSIVAGWMLAVAASGTVAIKGGSGSQNYAPGGAGGSLQDNGVLSNSGLLLVDGGGGGRNYVSPGGYGATLSDTRVLSNTGEIVVGGGAGGLGALGGYNGGGWGGTLTVAGNGTLANSGLISVQGGNGPKYFNSFAGSGGVLIDDGALTNSGTIALGQGSGDPSLFNGQSTSAQLEVVGQFTDSGLVTVSGPAGYGGASISVASGGTMTLDGGAGSQTYRPGGAGGVLHDAGVVSNAGLLLIQGGAGGDGYVSPGVYGAQLVDSGVLTNTAQVIVGGGIGGPVGLAGYNGGGWGGTLAVDGVMTNIGTVWVDGGYGPTYFNSFEGAGGVVSVTGTLTNTGLIALRASSGVGNALFNAQTPGAQFDIGGQFVDSGVVSIGGPADGYSGAELDVYATGTMLLQGGRITGTGLLLNLGEIIGTGRIAVGDLSNAGTIAATAGTLTIDAAFSGAGRLTVASGAVLDLVGATGTVNHASVEGAAAVLKVAAVMGGLLVNSPNGGKLDIVGGGTATLNAEDTNLTVQLFESGQSSNLTLGTLGFITAIGDSGGDSITAMAAGQTLTGGLGADTLTGAAATGDLFRDTASGLNGDTIVNFAGTDAIDITDIGSVGVKLNYVQNGSDGTLTVGNDGTAANITLAGSFSLGDFTHASDNGAGVLIQLGGG